MSAKGNKLILEFMGYKVDQNEFVRIPEYKKDFNTSTVMYHKDWNWLMPVVEHIENLGFEFFIVESRCKVKHNTDNSIETVLDFEVAGSKIEATYTGVIDFIQWYNGQLDLIRKHTKSQR